MTFPTHFKCNRCLKGNFRSRSSVLKHQQQPRSLCRQRYENRKAFLDIQHKSQCTSDSVLQNTFPSSSLSISPGSSTQPDSLMQFSTTMVDSNMSVDCLPPIDNNSNQVDEPMDTNLYPNDPWKNLSQNSSPHFIEEYDGAGQIFGTGPTFMDKFNQDKYSAYRKENLYYPFASRDEWEYSFFLVRSNMSLASVDELLKLQMVRLLYPFSCFYTYNWIDKISWTYIFYCKGSPKPCRDTSRWPFLERKALENSASYKKKHNTLLP